MNRSQSTLLHSNQQGPANTSISPVTPALTLPPALIAPAPAAAAGPGDHDLTALITQIGQEVKDRIAVYQFHPTLKFKFHATKNPNRTIKIRRYHHSYTISLDVQAVEQTYLDGSARKRIVCGIVYRLIRRSTHSSLPFSYQPRVQALLSLTVIAPLLFLLPVLFPFLILDISALVILGGFAYMLDVVPTTLTLSQRLPKRLLRHWDEKKSLAFLDSYGDYGEHSALLALLRNRRSRISHRQAAARTKNLKGIKL